METIAVFVNDAGHARHILQPMLQAQTPTHWVLVACAPKLTRHIGRWVSHSARQQWRGRWAAELFSQIEPELKALVGHRVETMVAKRPLVDVSAHLAMRFPQLRLLDARHARIGRIDEPIVAAQQGKVDSWAAPAAAAAGMSLVLTLAD